MLIHPTIDKLNSMRLAGMAKGLRAQLENPEIHNLPFEDRLALLVDAELIDRESRQLGSRLRNAKLRENAAQEDLDTREPQPRSRPPGKPRHLPMDQAAP